MAKAGRPRLDLNVDDMEKLAAMCCTMNEIASFFGCSVDTLENNYSDIIKKGRNKGKMSIRREQYAAAMKGNITMLIWLGKQLLDQQDKTQVVLEKITDEMLAAEAQRRLEHGKLP